MIFDVDIALELKEQFEKELLANAIELLPPTNKTTNTMEEKSMTNDFMKGMFGALGKGMCKITLDGGIAVKTSDGYKTYDKTSGSFINCDSFCFGGLDEMFFVVPTNAVAEGDIIFAKGKPRYVLKVDTNTITVINYENATVETILPERHIFMGNTYFYGKIVSMFGNGDNLTGGAGAQNIMKYMMMSQMCKNMGGGDMNPMMMMMFMNGGGFGDMFNNIFSAMTPPTLAPKTTETETDKEDK